MHIPLLFHLSVWTKVNLKNEWKNCVSSVLARPKACNQIPRHSSTKNTTKQGTINSKVEHWDYTTLLMMLNWITLYWWCPGSLTTVEITIVYLYGETKETSLYVKFDTGEGDNVPSLHIYRQIYKECINPDASQLASDHQWAGSLYTTGPIQPNMESCRIQWVQLQ